MEAYEVAGVLHRHRRGHWRRRRCRACGQMYPCDARMVASAIADHSPHMRFG